MGYQEDRMKLHLGCGDNYIVGWVNVDLAGEVDLHSDLRKPLPFLDQSVDFVFNEHLIEHLTYDDGLNLIKECFRVLKPEGVFRISTPDLDFLIECYQRNRIGEYADMGWNPETSCKFINEGMKLWGHQFIYNFKELIASLVKTGFSAIEIKDWRVSTHKELENLERRPYHQEIILEATK